jgi:hypothetical protein
MKVTFFWDVASCSLVYTDRRFKGIASIIRAMIIEAASSSETSVSVYQSTRRDMPEDSNLQAYRMLQ